VTGFHPSTRAVNSGSGNRALNGNDETYGVFVVVAVDMWSDDGEILESLRWRGVWNVDDHSEVITNCANAAFKRARQALLGQSEVKWQTMLTAFKYRYRRIVALFSSCKSIIIISSAEKLQHAARG